MSAPVIALTIIFGIIVLGSVIGFYAGARRKMDLEQWTVAGRGLGLVFVWLLMAGEIFTSFTFLGASGWAYSRGGPTLYIVAYATLNYVVSFFILPQIWEMGKKYKLQTEPDFFGRRYRSKHLAAFVSVVGVASIIPYLQLQFTGLGIIVEVASFNGIGRTPAMIVAVVLVAAFISVNGVRAVAGVSILKDFLMLCTTLVIGIGVPYIYFGGIGPMFAALTRARPADLVMPGATGNLGHAWFISTVLMTSFGGYMWPHWFGTSFTAKSGDTLRRNAILMPLYTLTLPLMLFVGFGAILIVPGLRNGDLALLAVVRRTFSPWVLGVIGGAGALTAMVPSAILILTAAALFAKNFYRPVFAATMSDDQVGRLARIMVLVISAATLCLAIYSSISLVSLMLLGYDGVAQFLPGVVLGLYWKRATMAGVSAGMMVGLVLTIVMVLSKRDPFMGLNAGFLALCANFLVCALVSIFTPMQPSGFDDPPCVI